MLGWSTEQLDAATADLVASGLAVLHGRRVARAVTLAAASRPANAREWSDQAKSVLDEVPIDGTRISNLRLRSKVELDNETYAAAVRELRESGAIRIGPGRGGTVARTYAAAAEVHQRRDLAVREGELYKPFINWLTSSWADVDSGFARALDTSGATGRQRSSGQWSRPDVTAVQVFRYPFLPDITVEVSSYEIKRAVDGLKLESIFEAAAHGRWAHRASLVIEDAGSGRESLSDRYLDDVRRFNLGLYIVRLSGSEMEVDEVEPPGLQSPEPDQVNDLLEQFFGLTERQAANQYKAAIGR